MLCRASVPDSCRLGQSFFWKQLPCPASIHQALHSSNTVWSASIPCGTAGFEFGKTSALQMPRHFRPEVNKRLQAQSVFILLVLKDYRTKAINIYKTLETTGLRACRASGSVRLEISESKFFSTLRVSVLKIWVLLALQSFSTLSL